MDEAFSNLDDLSERETYERLESLFESSLPPVSTVLQTYKIYTVDWKLGCLRDFVLFTKFR